MKQLLLFSKDGKKYGSEFVRFEDLEYMKILLNHKELDGIALLVDWDKKEITPLR